MNPEHFFDDVEPRWPYDDFTEEISAVKQGRKAISMFSFPSSAVEANDETYLALVESTLEAGLTLTVRQSPLSLPGHEYICAFAYREGDAWRVPALLETIRALRQYPPWSDGLEALESTLLGYSQEETAKWIAFHRARQLGWAGRTVYLLMTRDQRQRIIEHGSRSFPNDMPGEMVMWFVSRSRRPIRRDVALQCGPQHAVGRVAIARNSFDTIFLSSLKATSADVVWIELPTTRTVLMNVTLESKIEFLSPDGWV
jgi:hypothetical protein